MERWAKKMNEAKLAKHNAVKQAQMMQKEQEAREEAIRKQIQNEIMLQNAAAAATSAQSKSDAVKVCLDLCIFSLIRQKFIHAQS